MVTLLLLVGATLTLLALALLKPRLPKRQNFQAHHIPTSAGLALLPIILLTLGGSGLTFELGEGGEWYLVYTVAAGITGYMDDEWGGVGERGFAGHLGALRRGRATTGIVKFVVLGGGAIVFGVMVFGLSWRAFYAALVLAGCANLANLLDVRPGRALKFLGVPVVALSVVAPYGAVLAVAGVVGGALALFYFDLKGRIMLGDAGAAIWGAVAGYLVVTSGSELVWWVAGVAVVGLTAVAEFSSISRLIEEVGALRALDLWGRASDE